MHEVWCSIEMWCCIVDAQEREKTQRGEEREREREREREERKREREDREGERGGERRRKQVIPLL